MFHFNWSVSTGSQEVGFFNFLFFILNILVKCIITCKVLWTETHNNTEAMSTLLQVSDFNLEELVIIHYLILDFLFVWFLFYSIISIFFSLQLKYFIQQFFKLFLLFYKVTLAIVSIDNDGNVLTALEYSSGFDGQYDVK